MHITAVPKLPLTTVKINAKVAIDKHRDDLISAGFLFNGALFDTDPKALRNISYWHLQVNSGVVLPEGFAWRDANNIEHPADGEFIKALSLAITARGTQLYQASWQNKAAIDALTTVQDVVNYVPVWP
jgi:Domain of unknown function (DUF4376)